MLPSQPTTKQENPLLSASTSWPEKFSCSEVKSQETPNGKLWLISLFTENSMTRRKLSEMVRKRPKKLLSKKKLEMSLTLSTNSRKMVPVKEKMPKKRKKKVAPGVLKNEQRHPPASDHNQALAICPTISEKRVSNATNITLNISFNTL